MVPILNKESSKGTMRSHGGNRPVLPQNKHCPHCTAKFTRTTHLNRHMRTHTNERYHKCDLCGSQFTRSDLLTRHKKTCIDQFNRPRRKSCVSCTESKIKCDRQYPCNKCTARGKECVFPIITRRTVQTSSKDLLVIPDSDSCAPIASTSSINVISSPNTSKNLGTRDLLLPPSTYNDSIVSDTVTEVNAAVHSHLASMYNSDMFEPFFSNIFSIKDGPQISHPSPPESSPSEASVWPPYINPTSSDSNHSSDLNAVNTTDSSYFAPLQRPVPGPLLIVDTHMMQLGTFDDGKPLPHELDQYLYLFLSTFLIQMPIVHRATFSVEGKISVLLNAMRACGALFVQSQKAAQFVATTLKTSRDELVQEFARNTTDRAKVTQLIVAVALLQTVGLFHQKSTERASSTVYHGMLVMMIRRTGLIQEMSVWMPAPLTFETMDETWRSWVNVETTKRSLLMSYLHDCCHCVFFATAPSYSANEFNVCLPCEDALWRAGNALEWYTILKESSPYGTIQQRMTGLNIRSTMAIISERRELTSPLAVPPYGLFILAHAILRHLFSVCIDSRMSDTVQSGDTVEHDIVTAQFSMHNWLKCWLESPDMLAPENKARVGSDEPPFFDNALPFYWLGQVALLAYQERLPPFEVNSAQNLNVEVRFKLIKRWLKHIRGFLQNSDEASTLFWDELMKIRLQTWQYEIENDIAEDPDGLIGFFEKKL